MTKTEIRKKYLNIRRNVQNPDRSVYDIKIRDNFFCLLNKLKLQDKEELFVFSYASYESEADSFSISMELMKNGATLAYPLSHSDYSMEFKIINTFGDLVKGYKGILEPPSSLKNAENIPDFIIMPGVAFDKSGNRIGYGKGYYDRFLMKYKTKPLLIAICYECQIYNAIPNEKNDIKMDFIITEKSIYKC